MKLVELYENLNRTNGILQEMGEVKDGLLLFEGMKPSEVDSVILSESFGDKLSAALTFFKKRNIDEIEFSHLVRGDEVIFLVKSTQGNRFEGVSMVSGEIVQEHEFNSGREANMFADKKVEEGFRKVDDKNQIRKITRRVLTALGVAALIGGNLIVLGPALLVIGGWVWGLLSFVGGIALTAASAVGSVVASAAGFVLSGVGAGGGAAASTGVGAAVVDGAKTVGIAALVTAGSFTLLRLGVSGDDEPK